MPHQRLEGMPLHLWPLPRPAGSANSRCAVRDAALPSGHGDRQPDGGNHHAGSDPQRYSHAAVRLRTAGHVRRHPRRCGTTGARDCDRPASVPDPTGKAPDPLDYGSSWHLTVVAPVGARCSATRLAASRRRTRRPRVRSPCGARRRARLAPPTRGPCPSPPTRSRAAPRSRSGSAL